MKVLYIGGTGEISYACVQAAVAAGQQVSVFNRGRSDEPLPEGVEQIVGDLLDEALYADLADRGFDVVCQFVAFDLSRVEQDIAVFGGKVGQYVFISTASAYQKPPRGYIITEQTPLVNPYWEYSRKKAAMELRLTQAHASGTLPVTIVRPSHTYRRHFPGTCLSGMHMAWRMLQGKPTISHGDGSSLWVLTHSRDFAEAFIHLCGNERALGEAFHITSHEANPWDVIYGAIGQALGVEAKLVHVSSDTLVRYHPQWAGPLLGDKACSVWFDNSKVKSVVGGWEARIAMRDGMRLAAEYVRPRLESFQPDPVADALVDRIITEQQALGQFS